MAVREVLRMGDPRLLRIAQPVDLEEIGSTAFDQILQDMFDTMSALKGAGLAAPQIGIDKRIVIFGMDKNPRYPHVPAIPMTVLINPQIFPLTSTQGGGWEGCLSVPGMRGWVERFSEIRYTALDAQGNILERHATDFHARVVQHECDHLDGILYPSRITDMTKFGFIEELTRAGLIPALPSESAKPSA